MKYILSSAALICIIPIMLFSQSIKDSMPQILLTVSQVVFCTLFPMNVLLRLFCFSPLSQKLGGLLSKNRLWKKTGLSSVYLSSVMAGQLSGFPMTACLLPNGKNRGLALALGSVVSPAFLSAVLTPSVGLLLWLNQLLVLWSFAALSKKESEPEYLPSVKQITFSEALSSGISSAVAVSGAMIFFSSLVSLLPDVGFLREAVCSFLEVGSAAAICKSDLFLSIALSFGGLSALSQISFCAENTSLKPYLTSRAILILPTYAFFVFEKIRIFQTLLLFFFLMWQINRRNTCKKQ